LDTVTEITLAALWGGDKFFHLEHAKKSVETLKILRRASHAIDLLSHNQYTDLLFLLSSVSRQLLGREKSVLWW
jgi:hypothetical protein